MPSEVTAVLTANILKSWIRCHFACHIFTVFSGEPAAPIVVVHYTLMRQTAGSSEMSLRIYQKLWFPNPEYSNVQGGITVIPSTVKLLSLLLLMMMIIIITTFSGTHGVQIRHEHIYNARTVWQTRDFRIMRIIHANDCHVILNTVHYCRTSSLLQQPLPAVY